MKTQFIAGPVKKFESQLNELLAESQLALAVSSVTFSGGQLAAVVAETPVSPSVAGSAIQVKVVSGKIAKVNATLAEMQAENPCWHPLAVFPLAQEKPTEAAEPKGANIVAVLKLVQP